MVINRMDYLQENKELYNHEITYSIQLNSKITHSLTIMTILGTGEILIIKGIFPILCTWWWVLYFTSALISLIIFCCCVFLFYKAFNAYPYSYVNISEINRICSDKRKELKQKNIPSDTTEQFINKIFTKMLTEMYFNCALQNRQSNLKKSQNQQNLMKAYVINIICVFISFVLNIIITNVRGETLYV